MSAHPLPFAKLVELIDLLPLEERESLVEVVRRRNSEEARRRIAASVRAARREHAAGKSAPSTPDEIMREILG